MWYNLLFVNLLTFFYEITNNTSEKAFYEYSIVHRMGTFDQLNNQGYLLQF